MTQPQKHPLRAMSEQEERELQRLVKATSERLDVVRRAKALLAVVAGQALTQAGSSPTVTRSTHSVHLAILFVFALIFGTSNGQPVSQ